MAFVENKLVTCPYNAAHKVKASRIQLHIAKCKLNNLDTAKEHCPFNATHLVLPGELNHHLLTCPDRAPLDRRVTQDALDKNNPFKGRTAVPSYSEPVISLEEAWDIDEVDSYVPRTEAPPGSIVEPRPLAKPAERRRLYMELHRMPSEADSASTSSTSTAASSPAPKPTPMPRQPKQPSETQKLQSVQQQQVNTQAIQNLGLGRGRPPRIAANIFENNNGVASGVSNMSYTSVVQNMSNLGLGRGQNASQGTVPFFQDDDDFPALGCGRGVFHTPKQNLRTPGIRK